MHNKARNFFTITNRGASVHKLLQIDVCVLAAVADARIKAVQVSDWLVASDLNLLAVRPIDGVVDLLESKLWLEVSLSVE